MVLLEKQSIFLEFWGKTELLRFTAWEWAVEHSSRCETLTFAVAESQFKARESCISGTEGKWARSAVVWGRLCLARSHTKTQNRTSFTKLILNFPSSLALQSSLEIKWRRLVSTSMNLAAFSLNCIWPNSFRQKSWSTGIYNIGCIKELKAFSHHNKFSGHIKCTITLLSLDYWKGIVRGNQECLTREIGEEFTAHFLVSRSFWVKGKMGKTSPFLLTIISASNVRIVDLTVLHNSTVIGKHRPSELVSHFSETAYFGRQEDTLEWRATLSKQPLRGSLGKVGEEGASAFQNTVCL